MTFKLMNQDLAKLNKFDGANFTRWKDKIMFLITILNMLDPKLPTTSASK